MRSLRPLLTNRELLRCEAAWAVAAAGGWAFSIVYALYAYYEHGAAGVALAVAARTLGGAALTALATVRARAWPPRRAVTAAALVRLAAVEAVALAAVTAGASRPGAEPLLSR